jgi:hypothetical protein
MNDPTTNIDLEPLATWAESHGYDIESWSIESDADSASLTLELSQRSALDLVDDDNTAEVTSASIVTGLLREADDGIETTELIQEADEAYDVPPDVTKQIIERLRTRGEVYEPGNGILRTT